MIAFTAISLGMIYVGSSNKEVAQVIIFALMNLIELELGEPLTRLLSLGLGLLFLESSQRETPTNCILLDSYERLDLAFDALRNEIFGKLQFNLIFVFSYTLIMHPSILLFTIVK